MAGYGLDLFERLPSQYGFIKNARSSPVLFTHDKQGAQC